MNICALASMYPTDFPDDERPLTGIDPGRTQLINETTTFKGKVISQGAVLTRGRYYHEVGLRRQNIKFQYWQKVMELQVCWDEMSITHCKTTNIQRLKDGIACMLRHYDHLFTHMMLKCWEKENFRIFSKKQSSIAKALNRLQPEHLPNIKIAYGDGNFPSGKKFEKYVPCKWIKEECKRRYDAEDTNEFRTSSVCPDCFSQLFKVVEEFDNCVYEVRGLKWCNSKKCKSCPLKNRDNVGSTMIGMRAQGNAPTIMERNNNEPWLNADDPQNYHFFRPPGRKKSHRFQRRRRRN